MTTPEPTPDTATLRALLVEPEREDHDDWLTRICQITDAVPGLLDALAAAEQQTKVVELALAKSAEYSEWARGQIKFLAEANDGLRAEIRNPTVGGTPLDGTYTITTQAGGSDV